jgi:hypothetical protein
LKITFAQIKIACLALIVIVLSLVIIGLRHHSHFKVSRLTLGLSNIESENCQAPVLPSLWELYNSEKRPGLRFPNYNRDIVADEFGLFAAFASNSYYENDSDKRFKVFGNSQSWHRMNFVFKFRGGLYAETYVEDLSDRIRVLVVFRGTDGPLDVADHISNLSYFTQAFNPFDQYIESQKYFKTVRTQVAYLFRNKTAEFIAVGHSLGGGLATHVARAFPCTSAVTFNASFVTNETILSEPFPSNVEDRSKNRKFHGQIVSIFEDNDPLSRMKSIWNGKHLFSVNESHQWYLVNSNGGKSDQHSMWLLAHYMSYLPVDCIMTRKCMISKTPEQIKRIYCKELIEKFRYDQKNLCSSQLFPDNMITKNRGGTIPN